MLSPGPGFQLNIPSMLKNVWGCQRMHVVNIGTYVFTAIAVPGKNVKVNTAIVFIAALSCRVSSATWAVALANSKLSRLSRLDSSAILRELVATSIFILLSLWTMKLKI